MLVDRSPPRLSIESTNEETLAEPVIEGTIHILITTP